MDLSDQRLACLRMAMDLNCNTEPLIKAANELMAFVANGPPAPAAAEVKEDLKQTEAAAESVLDPIAACGTALQMPESGELALAEAANSNGATEVAPEAEVAVAEAASAETEVIEALAEDAAPEAEAAAEASDDASEADAEPVETAEAEAVESAQVDTAAVSQAAEAQPEEAATA